MLTHLIQSPYFSLALTTCTWCIGLWLQKKTQHILCNPLLISVFLIITTLTLLGLPFEVYQENSQLFLLLLAPVTAVLGLNIYRQKTVLKDYFIPILAGCLAGTLASLGLITFLGRAFAVEDSLLNSLLPKSVTTAIAMAIAESRGGIPSLAATGVMLAGLTGAIFAPLFAKIFRIQNPVAEGIAIGTASHALGTSRAMAIGKVQGAMSAIAICISGIFTSFLVLFLS